MARTHKAAEPLEGARDANVRRDLDEDILLRVDVNLQMPRLIEWAVQQREQGLRRGRAGADYGVRTAARGRESAYVRGGLACREARQGRTW